ncbi:hypothetical protein EZZ80_11340 [Pseudomonas putida]|nr:hypothetical protein FFH79_015245 [Pseudomonas sp. KBS0802]UZA74057.1 hypothetical protein EZZ80_11340 [Pseudomonas putida]
MQYWLSFEWPHLKERTSRSRPTAARAAEVRLPSCRTLYGCCPPPLNLPDDADQVLIKRPFDNGLLTIILEEREAGASKHSRSTPN